MYKKNTTLHRIARACVKRNYILAMKLCCVLLLIGCLHVSAYTYAQRVSIHQDRVSLVTVFQEIKKQTGYHVFYDAGAIRNAKPVTLQLTDASLEEALNTMLEGQGLSYRIVDKNIVITPQDEEIVVAPTPRVQEIVITGRVRDASGQLLAGTTVSVQGTSIATTTDDNGDYQIRVPNRNQTLIFSMLGYESLMLPLGGSDVLHATLQLSISDLDEVVVVGYGTQRAATITGSVSTVRGETLKQAPAINLSNSMAGRLPGLVAVSRSGEPGADGATFRIRGANTLGDNSPLIVVDGIPNRGLERINAADVESVTVLKDASAAIYGAQAANGVILITTKRGTVGKARLSVTHDQGFSMPTVIPEVADAATYVQMLNEIAIYGGQDPIYSQEDIQRFRDGNDPWNYPNTDWYAETFQRAASQRNTVLTISGGSESLNYYISGGANFQDGIYKNSATNYNQLNFRTNLDGKLSDYVKFGVSLAGREETRNFPTRSASDIFTMLRRGKPNMPAYWPNGMNGPDIEYGNNPVVVTTNQTGYDRNKTAVLETKANIDITVPWVEGLSVTANLAFDRSVLNNKLWEIPWYLYSWDGSTLDDNGEPLLVEGERGFTNPQLTQDMRNVDLLTMNSLFNYERTFADKHGVKALFGIERITGETMQFQAFRRHFVSTALDQLFAGGDLEKDNSGTASEQARLNYFGRLNYSYADKYLMEFVWRYDGSYIFPADKRFGFFPGVSLGWRASEENFWDGIKDVVNDFKLRASWGQTGNDRIEAFQFLSSFGFPTGPANIYVFNGNVENKILSELRIPNLNVTWEVANQSNIGFDASLLNNKLTFSAEYFYNLRTNILWQRNASVPMSTGLTLPRENIGQVFNQGAEFVLSYQNSSGNFQYGISANVNFNRNEIRFWDETPGVPEYQRSTGRPMNSGLYYRSIGVFRDADHVNSYPHWPGARPGDIIFEDVNNDGVIDGLDRVRIDRTDLPTHTGGLNLDLSYRGFYTSLFFQWATGAIRNNYYQMQGEVGNFLMQDVEGRWTADNPNADKPRIWNRYNEYWRDGSGNNTYWLEDSDYIRLKNIQIGYSIPTSLSEKLWLSGAQIYFTGMNLLTLTKVRDFDPETTSAVAYPLNKVYNLGITLTF